MKFSSVAFGGLKVGAMYAFSNEAGEVSNNNAYSAGLRYSFGPINLVAAYLQINRDANSQNANGAVSTDDGDAVKEPRCLPYIHDRLVRVADRQRDPALEPGHGAGRLPSITEYRRLP